MAAALGLIATTVQAQDTPEAIELPEQLGTPQEADAPDRVTAVATDEPLLFWPPRFEAELVIEIQNDLTFDSDDPDAELNDLYMTTELDVNTFFAEPLFLNTHFTLEPVEDPDPGQDRYFGDEGAFVENLSLNWEEDR